MCRALRLVGCPRVYKSMFAILRSVELRLGLTGKTPWPKISKGEPGAGPQQANCLCRRVFERPCATRAGLERILRRCCGHETRYTIGNPSYTASSAQRTG